MQAGLIPMKLAAIQKVERYAIVGGPGWLRKAVEAVNPLFEEIDMRTFAPEEEEAAWEWLGARSAE